MGQNRAWTEEEKEYLKGKWGETSISGAAKKLNRSVSAVKQKAYKMGLRDMRKCGNGYITLHQLALAFNNTNFTYKLISWVKQRGFPVKSKLIIKNRVRVVYIDKFWIWAEQHRDFIDFSKLEENILGVEPNWVKKQRSLDYAKNLKFKKTPWTKTEDAQLKYYLKQFKYTYDDLSKRLNRTCGAIQRRICDLGLKERPIKVDTHSNPWVTETKDDIALLKKGIKDGASYELLAEQLGRSSKAIRGKVYMLYRTERLDKVRSVI